MKSGDTFELNWKDSIRIHFSLFIFIVFRLGYAIILYMIPSFSIPFRVITDGIAFL